MTEAEARAMIKDLTRQEKLKLLIILNSLQNTANTIRGGAQA